MTERFVKLIAKQIRDFVRENFEHFQALANEYGGLDLTIGSDGDAWGWQTGDNSFTGGAYPYPHWGVFTIEPGDAEDPTGVADDIARDILDQIEEALNES